MRHFIVAAVFAVVSVPGALWAQAERRVALVIGNAAYEAANPLINPGNDAIDISVALEGLGFDVIVGTDMTRAAMLEAADTFAARAEEADVALFYFAGHGFQADGRNFLLPVDARFSDGKELAEASIRFGEILARLERSGGVKLAFLDACRDNPFGIALSSGDAISQGFAQVGTSADLLIAYATQPDAVAFDGTGRNSFFTEALLHHLYTPGQDVNDMLISVRRYVLAATGGLQIPWDNSSLTRRFVFDTRPRTASDETVLYQVAAKLGAPDLLRYYLDRYPDGAHAGEVVGLLEETPQRIRLSAASRGVAPADQLWELAQRSRARPLLEFYTETFPDHENVPQAVRLLRLLPDEDQLSSETVCRRLATHPNDETTRFRGIPMEELRRNAPSAVQFCSAAVTETPEVPHLQALLARAVFATGDEARAVEIYERAAGLGDVRALFTLGQLHAQGRAVGAPNASTAVAFYERAAEAGSLDAMLNLAVALLNGTGIAADPDRGIALLRRAAETGSAQARFNLGVLSRRGAIGNRAEALDHFLWAARNGEAEGYAAAATLLDQAFGVPRDTERAADLMLRAVAEDDGRAIELLVGRPEAWQPGTRRAIQLRLREAGLYDGLIDGVTRPAYVAALEAWRNGGFDPRVLTDGTL